MKVKSVITLIAVFAFIGCAEESNCIRCVQIANTNNIIEACEEPGITYTDTNGNQVDFDELAPHYESIGFDCD